LIPAGVIFIIYGIYSHVCDRKTTREKALLNTILRYFAGFNAMETRVKYFTIDSVEKP